MDANQNECRLCLSQRELVSVFECSDVGCRKMKELVYLTSGVEILEKDVISRKICINCSTVVLKMHEFRERSMKTDKYLREQCIQYLKATEIKIPNTDVTITTRKQPRKEADDPNANHSEKVEDDQQNQTVLNDSKKDESDDDSHNSSIPKKVTVHESISELFTRYPNIKLRTDVLVFNVNPFVSLELDSVEKYFKDKNVNLQLAARKAMTVNTARKKTAEICTTNVLTKNDIVNNNESDKTNFKVSPISIKLVENRTMFKVTPISINNDEAKLKDFSKDSKRQRENNESEDSITVIQQSKLKRRRLSSNDFTSDPEQSDPTILESLELKPTQSTSQPANRRSDNHKCNICLSVRKNAKDLKLHYQEHFCCSFCKAKFRLIERKICHEHKCVVRHALNSKPYVELTRVDQDLSLRNKYLFDKCHTVHSVKLNGVVLKNNIQNIDPNEIVVLSDDDDEPTTITTNTNPPNYFVSKPKHVPSIGAMHNKNNQRKAHVIPKEVNKIVSLAITDSKPKNIEKVGTECKTVADNPRSKSTISNNESYNRNEGSCIPNTVLSTEVPSPPYSSTAIVKPDIRIKDGLLLNSNMCSSDIVLLKELLEHSKGANHALPKPYTIEITKNGVMKNMFSQLGSYKVPVNIRRGDHAVNIAKPQPRTDNEVKMWDDIKPVPLINKNTNLNNSRITLTPFTLGVPILPKPPNMQHNLSVPFTKKVTMSQPSQINRKKKPAVKISNRSKHRNVLIPNASSPQPSVVVTSPSATVTVFDQNQHAVSSPNTSLPQPSIIMTSNAIQTALNNQNPILNQNSSSPQSSVVVPPTSIQTVFPSENGTIITNVSSQAQVTPTILNSSINSSSNYTNQMFDVNLQNPSNAQPIFIPSVDNRVNNLPIFTQSHNINNGLINNTENSPQNVVMPMSNNSTNMISRSFESLCGGSTVMTNSNKPILIPNGTPTATDCTISNYNVIGPLSSIPNQNNLHLTYANSNVRSLLTSQPIILNSTVATSMAFTSSNLTNSFTSNNVQHNAISAVQSSAMSSNFNYCKPLIRVKNLNELK